MQGVQILETLLFGEVKNSRGEFEASQKPLLVNDVKHTHTTVFCLLRATSGRRRRSGGLFRGKHSIFRLIGPTYIHSLIEFLVRKLNRKRRMKNRQSIQNNRTDNNSQAASRMLLCWEKLRKSNAESCTMHMLTRSFILWMVDCVRIIYTTSLSTEFLSYKHYVSLNYQALLVKILPLFQGQTLNFPGLMSLLSIELPLTDEFIMGRERIKGRSRVSGD